MYEGKRHHNCVLTYDKELKVVEKYKEGLSLEATGKLFGVNFVTVRNILKGHKVQLRKPGNTYKFFDNNTVDKIIELYKHKKLSQEKIANLLKTSQTKVSRVLKLNGIDCGFKRGKDNKNWKGGKFVRNNYVYILMPENSPFKSMAISNGYVAEHRYNMAIKVGRPLNNLETVHHINGNTLDNDISNLQLRHGKHGKHQTFICCDCGSKNIRPSEL